MTIIYFQNIRKTMEKGRKHKDKHGLQTRKLNRESQNKTKETSHAIIVTKGNVFEMYLHYP